MDRERVRKKDVYWKLRIQDWKESISNSGVG